ncbi:protein phosphatase 2C domain-containing protein [Kitasatospora sp. NPDC059571]|uniref:protein phosphatase 2C domain-containing protein n=1 Tax=Kitasatospora sp. NPDC059571 TaxID=3346871 RepID=UPI0036A451BB
MNEEHSHGSVYRDPYDGLPGDFLPPVRTQHWNDLPLREEPPDRPGYGPPAVSEATVLLPAPEHAYLPPGARPHGVVLAKTQPPHRPEPAVRLPQPPEAPGPAPHTGRRAPAYAPEPGPLTDAGPDPFGTQVPDTVVDGGTVGAATVRAASVRGDAHRYHREHRQDTVLLAGIGELALLVAADGVGSARFAHRGSAGACRLLAGALRPNAELLAAALAAGDRDGFNHIAGMALGRVAERLADEAANAGHAPADYATTLRALLVPTDPQVHARGFFAVGDGGLFRLRAGAWASLDGAPGAGPVLDTSTEALPVNPGMPRIRLITDGAPGDVLVLCTDGLAGPLARERDVQRFLAEQWGRGSVPGLAEFLWQAQIRARTYDDDRTAVCLWEGAP